MVGVGRAEAFSFYTSTSTAGSSTYDVFLNFKGEDTRKSFSGHLYSALNRERINVFMDSHKLHEGEEIGPKLIEAIQGSKISIPIFSKGYADSKWCLMELEKILECYKSNHQIVLPIFFDVEPSDVRHQSVISFEKAFVDHERNFHVRNSQPQRVKRWREALSKVGSMKGWVLNQIENGDESTLIQRVVERILRETNSIYLSDVKYPVGLDCHVNDIQSLLNVGSQDIRLVGICGEGGIGKTTIAKALYNLFVKSFHHNCFLENIREGALGGSNGLVSLQEKLIYSITKRKVAGEILLFDRGKEEIRNRCQGVNVLLVLDDVDDRSQLDAFAIDLNWLGQGSRVIITTRDEHILNVANVYPNNIYRPKELNFGQSLLLFSLHAFKQNRPLEEYKELSCDMACYSGGLPLTLEVLGSYLSDVRNKEEWESALHKLRASPHKEVYKKLKISYDNLEDDDQKAIFLDVACFFVGRKKRDIVSIWEACEYHPELAMKRLVQRSLLKIIAKEDCEEYLEMHDQIRDMGRQIVLEESCGMLGKRSRLWTRKEIMEVLEGHKGTENIKGILLPYQYQWEEPQFRDVYLSIECLEKMSSLKFLDIQYALFDGDDFPHLPYGLRWFSWIGCPIKVLRDDFYHKSLVHLDLSRSKIQLAWNSRPQNEHKKFQNLKALKFCACKSLFKCPDFSWFPLLERLDLSFCDSLGDLDESVGQLRLLKSLNLAECQSLSKLPQSIGQLSHLESLGLRYCYSLNKLPQSIGDLKSLFELQLGYTGIDELPDGVGLLERLEVLDVEGCKKLVKLPRSMGRMRCLHSIDLNGSTSISMLPNDFLMLSNLVELNMSSNVQELFNICPLPICFSVFSQLQTLRLFGCKNVVSLPADLSDLKNLQELGLVGLEKLGYLPELPSSLITLGCVECKSLARLPDLSKLKILRTLFLHNCYKLENKTGGIEGTESLERFWVKSCYKVTHTPRKQYFQQARPFDEGLRRYEPLIFPVPRCLGVLQRLTDSSQRPKAAGSDHLCILESQGVRRDYSFSNANANANGDGIHKRLSLTIVFIAIRSNLKLLSLVEEGELVDIQLVISADVFGKDGKRTNCSHSILVEKVEFTTQRDIIYIHDLGFPLEGRHSMSELIVEGRSLYKLSDSGVYHMLQTSNDFVELKFWSLEYVNEESGQALPGICILCGPWRPHLDAAAAGSPTLVHSHSGLIEQDKRSDYYFGNGTIIRYYTRWFSFSIMYNRYVRTDRFGLEEPEEDKRSTEETDSNPLPEEDKFSFACVDGGGSHSGPKEEEKINDRMTHPWELLLF